MAVESLFGNFMLFSQKKFTKKATKTHYFTKTRHKSMLVILASLGGTEGGPHGGFEGGRSNPVGLNFEFEVPLARVNSV